MRNTFPSKTIRNFFYTFLVSYKTNDKNVELEDIIEVISKQFKDILTKENLQKKINSYMLLEKVLIIRIVPNFIKNFALKFFAREGKKGQTTVLSNLGIVKLIFSFRPKGSDTLKASLSSLRVVPRSIKVVSSFAIPVPVYFT